MGGRNLASRAIVALGIAGIAACGGAITKPQTPPGSGVYLAHLDTSIRPQDDFFHFVNGAWIATNVIPQDKSRDGTFLQLREEADVNVRQIIERAAADDIEPDSEQGRIGQLYSSFMNVEKIDAMGVAPLADELARIDGIDSREKLLAFFAYADFAGVKTPLGLSVSSDFRDPDRYRVYLFQSGLGLPNSDFYSDESEEGLEIVAAYRDYAHQMYRMLGYSEGEAASAVAAGWALEIQLAASHRPPENNRNYPLWHNLYGPGHESLPPGVDWQAYFSGYGLTTDTVISVAQPEYLKGFASVLRSTPLAVWRDYLKLRLISSSAAYLGLEQQALSFDFYSRTLLGTPEMRPRWQRGVAFVNGAVGESIGRIYVAEYFPATAKARMDELVNNLVLAYRDSIESLDWMGAKTRANALEKLARFTTNIGYPDKWRDYSSMKLSSELLANVRAANRWDLERDLAKLGKPVDKREWSMNPQTVNAYFSPTQNSINFPAGILQAPFFDPLVDDAVNYGAIGAIIGHEIGHGFDDSGSQFDGDGRLENWWTDADRAAFKARTALLISQYDGFEVLPGVTVNGALTQGENIGDLAGVSIAYKAYLTSLGGKPAPVLDGYTGAQRFFIGFAQAFRAHSRDERARQMVKTDVHSPELFRVNGTLSNIDGFYRAFSVGPDDKMYREPAQRVGIW